jgi:hypothetical protein
LTLGGAAEHDEHEANGHQRRPKTPGVPHAEEDSSLRGLGGYHGHATVSGRRIYYSVAVFSEILPDGRENGIAVFDEPWKNVVATFYHELNEARTDPDIDEAIATGHVEGVVGWNAANGDECGDFPITEADKRNDLRLVFKEVPVSGGGTVPVQFQYSNAVHGPEGPIAAPHAVHAHT